MEETTQLARITLSASVEFQEQNYLCIENLTFVLDPKGNTMYVEGLKDLLKPGKDIQFPSNLIHEMSVPWQQIVIGRFTLI